VSNFEGQRGYAVIFLFAPAVVAGAGGLALLAADRPVPDDLEAAEFGVSFYENDKNNRFADLAFDQVTRDSAFATVSGTARIGAHSTFRMLSASFAGGDSHVFEIRLAPGPTQADTAWTEWAKTRDPLGKSEAQTGERYQVRYRVAPVPPTT